MIKVKQFPRTMVGGISLPRMIIGSNWFLGYSHRSPAQDKMICDKFHTPESFFPVFETYLSHGVDAIMACVSTDERMLSAIKYAEDKLGKKITIIDTPHINVDDTPEARRDAERTIKRSAEIGSTFCLMHHSSMEQLVNKNKGIIDRLPDYLKMKRDSGLIPGLSAHMPEAVIYADENGYDVETYVQIFNCLGFLMQIEIETVARIIHNANKPVMSIKPFAAGRVTPYVGLTFSWNAIRDCDLVVAGVQCAAEAEENIEISYATFEHRYPGVPPRSSPVKQQAVLSGKTEKQQRV